MNLENIRKMEIEESKQFFSTGQDFINGNLIYGVKCGTENFVLTSQKQFIPLKDAETELNIIPKSPTVEFSNLKSSTIKQFICEDPHMFLSPSDLFIKLKGFIQTYIYLKDEKLYTVLALWIITTYCYKTFSCIPYLHLCGNKGSGKSTLLTILKDLCFNAVLWSNITESVIFRYIDISNATLLLDEVESLNNPKNKNITCILNAGFQKDGTVARTNYSKESQKIINYSTYSMKAMAGINDIPEVLQDRCLNITMSKKPKNITLQKHFSSSKKIQTETSNIVQNLYIFALQNISNIHTVYENIDVTLPDNLSPRDTDMLLPLFTIAKIIDSDSNSIQDTLFKYAKEMSDIRNERDIEQNKSYRLITDLYTLLKDDTISPYRSNYYSSNDVFKYLTKKCNNYFYSTTTHLTKDLKNLSISSKRFLDESNSKKTYYQLIPEHIEQLIDSYGIRLEQNITENS